MLESFGIEHILLLGKESVLSSEKVYVNKIELFTW